MSENVSECVPCGSEINKKTYLKCVQNVSKNVSAFFRIFPYIKCNCSEKVQKLLDELKVAPNSNTASRSIIFINEIGADERKGYDAQALSEILGWLFQNKAVEKVNKVLTQIGLLCKI